MLVTSDIVRFWLEEGVVVTKCRQLIEYMPQACMKETIEELVDLRRLGDTDPSRAIIAAAAKIIMNSIYGRTLLRKDLFKKLVICDREQADKLMNSPQFRDIAPILCADERTKGEQREQLRATAAFPEDEEMALDQEADHRHRTYMVESAHKHVPADVPSHIGLWILWSAKLRNMRFMSMLRHYFDERRYSSAYCDTDSVSYKHARVCKKKRKTKKPNYPSCACVCVLTLTFFFFSIFRSFSCCTVETCRTTCAPNCGATGSKTLGTSGSWQSRATDIDAIGSSVAWRDSCGS